MSLTGKQRTSPWKWEPVGPLFNTFLRMKDLEVKYVLGVAVDPNAIKTETTEDVGVAMAYAKVDKERLPIVPTQEICSFSRTR